MRGEAPRFKRCCFCIPLRRGLLGWGYLILALNILKAILLNILYFEDMIILLPSYILLIVDVVFSILLIIACHKKSPKLLKVYFIYGIADIILFIATSSVIIYAEIQKAASTWEEASHEGTRDVLTSVIVTPATCFVDIFIYIYVLFLVRSERIKLREQNLEMQFVNNQAEAEPYCVCVEDSATCAGAGHGPSELTTTVPLQDT